MYMYLEDKIYEIMVKIREKGSRRDEIMRLLKYVLVDLGDIADKNSGYKKTIIDDRKFFVDVLYDLIVKEEDYRFLDIILNKTMPFFDMIDNSFGCNSLDYVISLYAMFKAYKMENKNYVYFVEIVEDFSFKYRHRYFLSNLNNVIKMIDFILSDDIYFRFPELRNFCLEKFKNGYAHYFEAANVNDYIEIMDRMKKIYEIGKKMEEGYYKYESIDTKVLLEKILNKSLEVDVSKISETLFVNGRYSYLTEKIQSCIHNSGIKIDLFDDIAGLNYKFFNDLNSLYKENNDSFKKYIDVLFDSDSYVELRNKLDVLKEADTLYCRGLITPSLEKLDLINSDSMKEVRNGRRIAFSQNTMNIVDRPNTIVDRMIKQYRSLYPDMSIELILKTGSNRTLKDYIEYVDSNILSKQKEREEAEKTRIEQEKMEEERRLSGEYAKEELRLAEEREKLSSTNAGATPVVEVNNLKIANDTATEEKKPAPQKKKGKFWSFGN